MLNIYYSTMAVRQLLLLASDTRLCPTLTYFIYSLIWFRYELNPSDILVPAGGVGQ